MNEINTATNGHRSLKTFGVALFILMFLPFVYSIEGCKDKVMNTDDVPCLLLLQFNIADLNCVNYNVSIYKEDVLQYSLNLSNYTDSFMCSALNNLTALGTYTARYSTGDTADWVVEGGTKMIWLLYLAIAIFFIIFGIGVYYKDANVGAISGIGFFCVGLFMFLLIKGTLVVTGLTLESNLLTEALAIIVLGFGMLIIGNSMEEWFGLFGG